MNLPCINDGIRRFDEVEISISSIDIGLKRVIDCYISNDATLILYNMFIRPNAVICLNCIISEGYKSLWSHLRPEYNIAHILEIVVFILFFIWIDLRVCEVKSKIQLIWIVYKELLNLFWRGARSRRVSVIVACSDSDNILGIWLWGVFSIKIKSGVERRTQPSSDF